MSQVPFETASNLDNVSSKVISQAGSQHTHLNSAAQTKSPVTPCFSLPSNSWLSLAEIATFRPKALFSPTRAFGSKSRAVLGREAENTARGGERPPGRAESPSPDAQCPAWPLHPSPPVCSRALSWQLPRFLALLIKMVPLGCVIPIRAQRGCWMSSGEKSSLRCPAAGPLLCSALLVLQTCQKKGLCLCSSGPLLLCPPLPQ